MAPRNRINRMSTHHTRFNALEVLFLSDDADGNVGLQKRFHVLH